ncbi:MAG: hypothetical protein HZA90_16845 [Verrucomicrobia bacterium]|nr:hypothetical protein [Verrucomicrobiota bacterium]
MKQFGKIMAALGAWLFVAVLSSAAQGTNVTPTVPPAPVRHGQIVVPEKPPVNGPAVAVDVRPTLAERRALPPEVRARIDRFRDDARRYLEQQEKLRKLLQGANDEDRARIRAELQALREQWVERSLELRKEFKERQRELADRLPSHRELFMEDSKTTLKQQLLDNARDQQPERPPRGIDN